MERSDTSLTHVQDNVETRMEDTTSVPLMYRGHSSFVSEKYIVEILIIETLFDL